MHPALTSLRARAPSLLPHRSNSTLPKTMMRKFSSSSSSLLSPSSISLDAIAIGSLASLIVVSLTGGWYTNYANELDVSTSAEARSLPSERVIMDALRRQYSGLSNEEMLRTIKDSMDKDHCIVIPGVLTGDSLKSAHLAAKQLTLPSNPGIVTAIAGKNGDQAITHDITFNWIRDTIKSSSNDQLEEASQHLPENHPSMQQAISLCRTVPSFLENYLSYTKTAAHSIPHLCRVALMPGTGSSYLPHRDATIYSFLELGIVGWLASGYSRKRVITAILYLNNEKWLADGEASNGSLRLHAGADRDDLTGETSTRKIDVVPNGGTLVIFDSRTLLHEVLATDKTRISLTCWTTGE